MKKVVAHSIAPPPWPSSQGEIVAIEDRLGCLRIEVRELGGEGRLEVSFTQVEGLRVLDEMDLTEFWPACSSENGWIFEITQGGWLSQEIKRPAGLIAHADDRLREFLVAGIDDCVSVLAMAAPEIRSIES